MRSLAWRSSSGSLRPYHTWRTSSFIITTRSLLGLPPRGGFVGVEALDDRCELVPVYVWFYFCEFVAEFLYFFVGFSEQVRVKRVHKMSCSK